jgi:hypothetical protein
VVRVATAVTVVTAAGLAALVVWAAGSDPRDVLRLLDTYAGRGYAAWYVWVLACPVLLLATALVARRRPWPYVVVTSGFLASAVGAAFLVAHWMPGWGWPGLAAVVAAGLASVVGVLREAP